MKPEIFGVYTNDELRELGMTVENWTPPAFNLNVVPKELHDLIPLARRWGIGCDVTRHDAGEKATEADLAEIVERLKGRHTQIYRWLYSQRGSSSDEAHAYSALVVFEMEEANGPGIPGLLTWRIHEFMRDPSDENRALLREAYDKVLTWSPFMQEWHPLGEAKSLLDA